MYNKVSSLVNELIVFISKQILPINIGLSISFRSFTVKFFVVVIIKLLKNILFFHTIIICNNLNKKFYIS
jgi:hypothetical protein